MQSKLIEIRDYGTCMIALAVCPDAPNLLHRQEGAAKKDRECLAAERWAWERSGYPSERRYVLLYPIDPDVAAGGYGHKAYDSQYQDRTWTTTHEWLIQHFDEIDSGAVLDVRVILGETEMPAISDRLAGVASFNAEAVRS